MISPVVEIEGLYLIDYGRSRDERGFFARLFDARSFEQEGLASGFCEHSLAYNAAQGTVRGMHYQIGDAVEAKIVRCLSGRMFDVAVDVRPKSPSFGKWFGIQLDAEDSRALYIPRGFAHGYQTLADETTALYLISNSYSAEMARGIRYSDPQLAIEWPLAVTRISERDANLPFLVSAELP